jgi:8-amino-7-oxononanoate synthase
VLENWLHQQLEKRKEEGLYRSLVTKAPPIDFTSNDYLGLSRSVILNEMIEERIKSLGIYSNGATGSRLLSGNSSYIESVEQYLAQIFNGERALLFNSGYNANLAVLSALPQRGDTILYDALAHSCMKDGARLSLANRFSFKHNDLLDLEDKLKRAKGRIFIAVESIYSMDGDEAPLAALDVLAQKYGATLIIDEAHSTGVVGTQGCGLSVTLGLSGSHIRIYTFGKGMGVHGAAVVGSSLLIEYLINFARPFIYTTAMSPHSVVAIACAFEFLGKNMALQKDLHHVIQLFLAETTLLRNRTHSTSSIQTAIFSGNQNVRRKATSLQQQGFDVRPILSPTVPVGEERLRICLHSFNTSEEVVQLAKALVLLSNE